MKVHKLLFFVLAFAASPAQAGPGYCKALESDRQGQSIEVTLHVGQAGEITSREAMWEMHRPGSTSIQGLSLEIGYVSGTSDAIGPATSVDLNFAAFRNPPDLAGAQGTLELEPGHSWAGRYQGMLGMGLVQLAVKTPWGGRLNPELVDAIDSARQATATLRGRDGSVIESIILNPSDHATRDRLFRQALATAERLAAAPEPCR